MSSDEEFINYTADDGRRRSLASPVPPSAGGLRPESPRFDRENDGNNANDNNNNDTIGDDFDQGRASLNGAVQHITASEVANSDPKVRQVLYSDVLSTYFVVYLVLTRCR
jgi:hypothetical protein